jgi:hypothetical protein
MVFRCSRLPEALRFIVRVAEVLSVKSRFNGAGKQTSTRTFILSNHGSVRHFLSEITAEALTILLDNATNIGAVDAPYS